MKIQYLEIKNYKQFTDLKLDLTYPKGHQKEGEPLDKICIIGQSGTGKTNLLNIIKNKKDNINIKILFTNKGTSVENEIYFAGANKVNKISHKSIISKDDNKLIEKLKTSSHTLLAKDNGDYDTSSFEHEMLYSAIKSIENKYHQFLPLNSETKNFIDIYENSWELLEKRIENYKDKQLKYMNILSNKLLNNDSYEKKNFQNDMQLWESENENIIENISDKLNDILIKFNLKLAKIDKNQKNYDELIIEDLSNNKIIKYDDLSTGTKNLLSTFIPLQIHTPKDSIILIDEPEISFYPDIQTELTDLYMDIGTNNQLIMATHSPLVASSFEPWEIVELKFDKNNQIYRELYYDLKKENHIDNYTLDPRLLTWTSILTDIFDLKTDSNFTFREKKLMEYIRLEKELKLIKDKKEKLQRFEELMKRSELLGLGYYEKN